MLSKVSFAAQNYPERLDQIILKVYQGNIGT